jgi:hypothetical protein
MPEPNKRVGRQISLKAAVTTVRLSAAADSRSEKRLLRGSVFQRDLYMAEKTT